MAERRMFAKSIVLSDAFLDMPLSARCLYFTLGMLADDDGFVGSPKAIMRQCGASQDDMLVLLQKRFILAFESGVIVIKHWRMNNYLQNDRHKTTTYIEELETLKIDSKGAYTEKKEAMYTECIQNVYTGKNSIGKDSIDNVPPYIPPKGNEPKKPTATELRKTFNRLVEESDLSDALKIKMLEWLDYKTQIKNQYKSPDGFSKLITQVAKKALEFTDAEVIRVMDETMAAGYKGFVWDWLEKKKQSTGNSTYVNAIQNRLNVVDDWLSDMQNGGG